MPPPTYREATIAILVEVSGLRNVEPVMAGHGEAVWWDAASTNESAAAADVSSDHGVRETCESGGRVDDRGTGKGIRLRCPIWQDNILAKLQEPIHPPAILTKPVRRSC
jgi:hypothetical protein